MKNIDKIRAMSVEDLAKWKRKRTCDSGCVYELACDGGVCDGNRCLEGLIKWLNQEVNPMPKLKIGYIISSYYPTTDNKVNYVYLGNSVLWCDKDERFVKFENNMKKFVKAIYRKDVDDFTKVEIWRADNEDRK